MSERSKRVPAPAHDEPNPGTAGSRTLVSRHSIAKKRAMGTEAPVTVLIVDDEDRNRRLLEVFIQAEGYAALCAASGEEGISMARAAQPDLVLLDLMMPGCDGFEVARTLRNDTATAAIPLLIVSSLDDAASRARVKAAGAEALIVKPVDRWALSEAMDRALQSRSNDARERRHG